MRSCYSEVVRAAIVLGVAFVAVGCDCSASHEREPRDGGLDAAEPADTGADVVVAPDAGTCAAFARVPLGGSRAYGIAHADDHVAVTMSNRVAIVPLGMPEPMQVPLPVALTDADGNGALIAPDLDGFLLGHGSSVVRMDLAGALGPVTTLPADNELPRVIDLEGRLEGERFAALIWDARAGGGEDLPPVGPTKLFLLDATGTPTSPPVVVSTEDRMLEPMAIASVTGEWWYVERGWDAETDQSVLRAVVYDPEGTLLYETTSPIGNVAPMSGDPLDRWSVERIRSDHRALAWTNRSRIFGSEPEDALHVQLLVPPLICECEREIARAPTIAAFSTTQIGPETPVVAAWTTGGSTVYLDGVGAPSIPRGTFDFGPGAIRSVHLTATSDRTLALAYELTTPDGSLEAWLALIECL